MKRLIVVLPLLLLAGMVSLAMAGDYHKSATLVCSDCHIMHYSQQHGYAGGAVFPTPAAGGPFHYLLRAGDVNQTCLLCHNGQPTVPDVFGSNVLGTAPVRLAGALNAEIGSPLTNDGGYDPVDGHTLYSMAVPPDQPATPEYVPAAPGLECHNCHGVHGTVSYRNLGLRGMFAGDTVSYATGVNDGLKDVFQRSSRAYEWADVDYNEPSTVGSKYAKWCQNCHYYFHGANTDAHMADIVGTATMWKRHPQSTENISNSSTTSRWRVNTNHVKVMDSAGLWDNMITTGTPSCFSCHKSHGNQNGFGLIFMAGTGTITEQGDNGSTLREMCRQCHGMGT